MKKVYSNRLIICFSVFGILFFSITIFVCAFSLINSVINEQSNYLARRILTGGKYEAIL